MKAIKCEMCSSIDVVKDGDYYVCQSCGTKYTVEAAKKLMVEGTVKIDSSEETANLYELARRAANTGNTEKAQQYYEQIVVKAPNDWEAFYYSVYYQCTNCKVGQLEESANQLFNTNRSALTMIASSNMDAAKTVDAINQIKKSSFTFADMITANVKMHGDILSIGDCIRYMKAEYNMLYSLGDIIESYFLKKANDAKFQSISPDTFISCWKKAIDVEHSMIYGYVTERDSRRAHRDHINSYAVKIQKYQPSYTAPEVFIRGETKGKGCYVATCVYGSYDCPQVWTLRRYRDDTLGATWYGRAFIRTYYAISPTLVKWFGKTTWFKKMWQGSLDRMVKKLNEKGVENTPYQDKQW